MKKTKIGINGFGRIGRLTLRAAWGWPEFEVVLINDPVGGAACAAHLLNFDSVQGRWAHEAVAERVGGDEVIRVGATTIAFSGHRQPGDVDWAGHGVEIVLECSGKFRTPADLAVYFERGVKKVIVAAPVKGDALNIVMGVNDGLYEPAKHRLLTNASCTTNCLAPVVKVMHEGIGIEHGAITTLHDVTNTQTPLLTGSLTDCVFQMKRATTVEEVNALLKAASERGPLQGILGFETRPLVSVDYKGDPRSAIIDALSTMVVNQRMVKIYAWYDNEWGYSNRMAELTRKVAVSL